MTPGEATGPILWGALVIVPLVTHCLWRSYPLASLAAAGAAIVVDQIALQIAYIIMQRAPSIFDLARMFFFFPVALVFAFIIGLPFLLLRRRRRQDPDDNSVGAQVPGHALPARDQAATIAPQAAKRPRRLGVLDLLYLAAAVTISLALIRAGSAEYQAGAANRSGVAGYAEFGWLLTSCGAWFAMLAYGLVVLLVKRPRLWIWLVYLVLAVVPPIIGASTTGPHSGRQTFEAGFRHWTSQEVDADAIRVWLATRPAPEKTVELPPADWPEAIRRLQPERVDLCKGGGVALTWGRVGHDGDRRQIFIGHKVDFPPPPEGLWLGESWEDAWVPINDGWPAEWQQVKPGVWYWVLGQA